jgi:hypothetical protein
MAALITGGTGRNDQPDTDHDTEGETTGEQGRSAIGVSASSSVW